MTFWWFTVKQLSCHMSRALKTINKVQIMEATIYQQLKKSVWHRISANRSLAKSPAQGERHLNILKSPEISCPLALSPLTFSLSSLQLQDRSFKMQNLIAQSWINSEGEGGQVCYTLVHTGFVPPCAGTGTKLWVFGGLPAGRDATNIFFSVL